MIDEQALGWVIRTRDTDFQDWDAFTLWLEADPAHAAAYDAMAMADADLPQIVPAEPVTLSAPANDVEPGRWRPLRWVGGGAIAAVLVATLSLTMWNRADIYTVATAPGEIRVIALKDGTRVELNGDSSLRLDHNNSRFAALDNGEATFTVRHDENDPFRVTVGDAVFEDAGTIFNIVHDGPSTRIGVAEGKVIYNPQSDAIALPAGRALSDDGAHLLLTDIAPEAVASWRQGRLIYDNAPVGQVIGDVSRSLGVKLTGTASARAMRFTGTVALDRNPERFFASAAPLMGLQAVRQGDGWILKERDGSIP